MLCRSILVGNGDSLLYAFPVCLQRHLWAKADVPGAAAETAGGVAIPSERTVYRVMKEIGLVHHPRRRPNGITKADREARKSDDLLKRDFSAEKSLEKCVTDITERKAKDGRLYVSAIFDCFDLTVLGLAMDESMRAELCVRTLDSAAASYPALRGAIVHSDRGSQYTSGAYRAALEKHGIRQSMNSDGGRCHDNARCESMWARMKCELFYDRIAPENMTVEQLKTLIWRYFISYWNRRINFPGISIFQHNICIHI